MWGSEGLGGGVGGGFGRGEVKKEGLSPGGGGWVGGNYQVTLVLYSYYY